MAVIRPEVATPRPEVTTPRPEVATPHFLRCCQTWHLRLFPDFA